MGSRRIIIIHSISPLHRKMIRLSYFWLVRCHHRGCFVSNALGILAKATKISFVNTREAQEIAMLLCLQSFLVFFILFCYARAQKLRVSFSWLHDAETSCGPLLFTPSGQGHGFRSREAKSQRWDILNHQELMNWPKNRASSVFPDYPRYNQVLNSG